VIITPKTKVAALLETYPQLENTLLAMAPAFAKLKNPILRRTVARVTSLQQAASVAGIAVADLVNTLRAELGQAALDDLVDRNYAFIRPDWASQGTPSRTLDATALLAEGVQPVDVALAELADLPEGQIYCVLAPFLPAPLIDKATSLGLQHWIDRADETTFEVWFFCPGY
jgi:hypothetical protein